MTSIVLPIGFAVGVVAAGLVYVDALRRNLPRRTRLAWTAVVGTIGVGGFSAAYVLDDVLYGWYLQVTGRVGVTPSPREVAVAFLVVGLGASAVAVLAYGLGSRYGPLEAG